jgi:hypothetical protein
MCVCSLISGSHRILSFFLVTDCRVSTVISRSAIVDNLDFEIHVNKSLNRSHETMPYRDDKCSCCEMAFLKFYTLQPHMGKL